MNTQSTGDTMTKCQCQCSEVFEEPCERTVESGSEARVLWVPPALRAEEGAAGMHRGSALALRVHPHCVRAVVSASIANDGTVWAREAP